MPVTIDQLAVALQQFFHDKVPAAGGDSPGSIALVFDRLGTSLSAAEFGVGGTDGEQQLLSHQRAAQLADQIPAADGLAAGWYFPRTGSRLTRWYETLVTDAVAAGADPASFAARRSAAANLLLLNKLPEATGVTTAGTTVDPTGVQTSNYATGMTPVAWYRPDSDAWEAHRIDDSPAGAPPVPRDAVPAPRFAPAGGTAPGTDPTAGGTVVRLPGPAGPATLTAWVKAPGQAVGQGELLATVTAGGVERSVLSPVGGVFWYPTVGEGATVAVDAAVAVVGPAPSPAVVVTMPAVSDPPTPVTVARWSAAAGSTVRAGDDVGELVTDKVDLQLSAPAGGQVWFVLVAEGAETRVGAPLAVIGPPAAPRPVAPPTGFTVAFEYCVVTFHRPWWDEVYLAAGGWSVPGFGPGTISDGTPTSAAPVTLITDGMVVVRNLEIRADWSDGDVATLAANPTSLGPFSLTGASVDHQTLTRPGMQPIAWICQVPARWPPD